MRNKIKKTRVSRLISQDPEIHLAFRECGARYLNRNCFSGWHGRNSNEIITKLKFLYDKGASTDFPECEWVPFSQDNELCMGHNTFGMLLHEYFEDMLWWRSRNFDLTGLYGLDSDF